jgi:hypothetical protein
MPLLFHNPAADWQRSGRLKGSVFEPLTRFGPIPSYSKPQVSFQRSTFSIMSFAMITVFKLELPSSATASKELRFRMGSFS